MCKMCIAIEVSAPYYASYMFLDTLFYVFDVAYFIDILFSLFLFALALRLFEHTLSSLRSGLQWPV